MTQQQIDQLVQLQKLLESGILTQDEFLSEKSKILNSDGTSTASRGGGVSLSGFYQKFRIPFLILLGFVVGLIIFFVVFKCIPSQKGDSDTMKDAITSEVDDNIFEDKFERLWVIGSVRDYISDDLNGWNKDDLKILRNYYFAKCNFYFGSKELRDYFAHYSLYQPLYKDANDMFTELQINNVQYIKKLEGLSNYYQER